MTRKIRVLVVDDSIFFRKILTKKLSEFKNIEIVGDAYDAFDAKNKISQLRPDVITMDVEMPGMSGIDFLKQMRPNNMLRVVLVSSVNMNVFDALSAGAVDFIRKPNVTSQDELKKFFDELLETITTASTANIRTGMRPQVQQQPIAQQQAIPLDNRLIDSPLLSSTFIAIGASTGGTEAGLSILKELPAHTPGIVIVQHMPPGFTNLYAQRLDSLCAMEVREAQHGDIIQKGRALIAPGDFQMKVVKTGTNYTVNCYKGERVSGHCPSVDVLFDSVADVMGNRAIGVILTGMGSDGAKGLLKMRHAGSYTIGQDKDSCVVYGMPMVANDIGAVTVQVPCDKIAGEIKKFLNKR